MIARPLVSILLPAYDAASTLPRALASIRRQTLGAWECVIVDDGSHDETRALAAGFAARDARFRVLSAPHAGIVPALRLGLRACTGRYVARMDADDLMSARRLERQVAALEADASLDAVGCHVRLFPRAGISPKRAAYVSWLNSLDSVESVLADAFVECPIAHPTLLGRRSLFEQVGYREVAWPEDYDLILRWLGAGARIAVVPEVLLGWRDSPGRLSRTAAEYALDRFVACKAAFLAAGFLRASDEYVLWGYGDTGRELSRALLELGKRPAQIVELHPGRIGQRIAGARVIPPAELPRVERRPIVASVAGAEARALIRGALGEMGFVELRDFVCAA